MILYRGKRKLKYSLWQPKGAASRTNPSEANKGDARRQITYLVVAILPANLACFLLKSHFLEESNAAVLCEIKSAPNWKNSLVTLKASLCPIHSAFLFMMQARSIHHVLLLTFVSVTIFSHLAFLLPISFSCLSFSTHPHPSPLLSSQRSLGEVSHGRVGRVDVALCCHGRFKVKSA